jgi:hypothetical protein
MSNKQKALALADECATGHPLEADAIGASLTIRSLLARAEDAEARYMALLKSVADGKALQQPPPMLISDPSGLVAMLQARAESAEAERDRLRAALDTELATQRRALAHDRELRDALTAERDRLRDALKRITSFTSATPSLSESGCGRLLAQIEHEAQTAIDAAAKGQG